MCLINAIIISYDIKIFFNYGIKLKKFTNDINTSFYVIFISNVFEKCCKVQMSEIEWAEQVLKLQRWSFNVTLPDSLILRERPDLISVYDSITHYKCHNILLDTWNQTYLILFVWSS